MKAYASGTSVSAERSRAEIETLLGKHGATQRAIAVNDDEQVAHVHFLIHGYKYRLEIPLPKPADRPASWSYYSPDQKRQWEASTARLLSQKTKERWRAIVLVLKAKLEMVQLGLSSVEKEFMADLVMANGQTMHHEVAEALSRSLATGMALVLALPEASER
jgi:hypothetical protein